ncbi:MAG: ABC transporter substrate-binding protein [Planctomycetes bacterium]|nr:ABC transporter substrate-binding protein [Planctomycetota bacterium]
MTPANALASTAGLPQRVVVANTALVDDVTALIGPERVAAICSQAHTWSALGRPDAPPDLARWRSVPTFDRFVVETLLARRPDLVLCGPYSRAETVATLEASGVRVVRLPDPPDLDGVWSNVAALGDLLGVADRARALLADLDRRVAALREGAARRSALTAVFYTQSGGQGWSSGAHTLADAALELVGLRRPLVEVAGRSETTRLTFDLLLALDPDLLIVPAPFGEVDDETQRALAAETRLAPLTALREGGVIALHPALFSTTSHRIVATAEAIAAAVDARLAERGGR